MKSKILAKVNTLAMAVAEATKPQGRAPAIVKSISAGDAEIKAMDCMMVWEYYIEDYDNRVSKFNNDGGGAMSARQIVHDDIVPFVNKWWEYSQSFLEFDDSYDWDFIPVFLDALPHHNIERLSLAQISDALRRVRHKYSDVS